MRLKEFLNRDDPLTGEVSATKPGDNSPEGAYEAHKAKVAELLEQIDELIEQHSDGQSEQSGEWKHAKDLAEVAAKLQEIVDMLQPDGGDDDGEVDEVTEGIEDRQSEAIEAIESKIAKLKAAGKTAEASKLRSSMVTLNKRFSKGYESDNDNLMNGALDDLRELVKEATNHMGERTQQTFAGWKRACKAKHPDVWFNGDADIAEAMVGQKPYKRGETHQVGEWDGASGSVYN